MADLAGWLLGLLRTVGNPYVGVFLVSLGGNVLPFFPIPYLIAIFTIAIEMSKINIFLLTFVSALGATLGKFVAYGVGFGGRLTLGEKYKRRFNALRVALGGSPFVAALVFAASPLPDDLIMIPLGMIKYSPIKTFLALLIGKFILTFAIVWSARFSRQTIAWIIGPENQMIWVVSIVVVVVLTVIMIKVDWEKIITRRALEKLEMSKPHSE
jgi:membrane protein DedA with SNARE-associated domain